MTVRRPLLIALAVASTWTRQVAAASYLVTPQPVCTPGQLCLTTFATNLPIGSYNAGPFGIMFYPDGTALVTTTWNMSPLDGLYLYPNQDQGMPNGCPSTPFDSQAAPVKFQAYAAGNGFKDIARVLDLVMTLDGRVFATGQTATQGILFEIVRNGATFTALPPVWTINGIGAGGALDPVSGEIVFIMNNAVNIYDPVTTSRRTIVYNFAYGDGLVFASDGGHLWVADNNGNAVVEFVPVRDAAGAITGLTFKRNLGGGLVAMVSDDGVAVGLEGTCMAGHLVINDNNGYIDEIDLATGNSATLADGGSRGDFCRTNSRGWLFLTQSSSIEVLKDLTGRPLFEPPGPGCRNLATYAQELEATCGLKLSANLNVNFGDLCRHLDDANEVNDISTVNAIDQMMTAVCRQVAGGSLSTDCIAKARVLLAGLGILRQTITGAPTTMDPSCGTPVATLQVAPNVLKASDPNARIAFYLNGTPNAVVTVRIYSETGGYLGSLQATLDGAGKGVATLAGAQVGGRKLGPGTYRVQASGGGIGGRQTFAVTRR